MIRTLCLPIKHILQLSCMHINIYNVLGWKQHPFIRIAQIKHVVRHSKNMVKTAQTVIKTKDHIEGLGAMLPAVLLRLYGCQEVPKLRFDQIPLSQVSFDMGETCLDMFRIKPAMSFALVEH